MKFFCDQMLEGLGKWLRTAGYDTLIASANMQDQEIFARAVAEGRLLLTRDRQFLEMENPQKNVIFLHGNSIEECVKELNGKLKINWLFQPFSRCLVCNTSFTQPTEQTILEQAPPDVRTSTTSFRYCPHCKKVFWEGSHTAHMLQKLQHWQKLI